ncbi:hypothetical protein BH11MYX2_BH11MYX2_09460 [soil metagenome]
MIRLALAACSLAACAKNTPAPSSSPPAKAQTEPAADRTPQGLEAAAGRLRGKACACPENDQMCGTVVRDELATWKASVGTPMSSDPAVEQRIVLEVQNIEGCIRRAAGEK